MKKSLSGRTSSAAANGRHVVDPVRAHVPEPTQPYPPYHHAPRGVDFQRSLPRIACDLLAVCVDISFPALIVYISDCDALAHAMIWCARAVRTLRVRARTSDRAKPEGMALG